MPKYKVVITEVYRKPVVITADSEAEAHRRAQDAWANGEVNLGLHDSFEGVEFFVAGQAEEGEDLFKVERKD